MRAHPRSRGENVGCAIGIDPRVGSSPLTRGKPWKISETGEKTRLIPAHAGKTSSALTGQTACRAHPRSRGENLGRRSRLRGTPGSSPLTRGKPERGLHRPERGRLIPAHAGKTHTSSYRGANARAHPRSRGENLLQGSGQRFADGSSPLTRGKPSTASAVACAGRLIPAHAGKTASCTGLHAP